MHYSDKAKPVARLTEPPVVPGLVPLSWKFMKSFLPSFSPSTDAKRVTGSY